MGSSILRDQVDSEIEKVVAPHLAQVQQPFDRAALLAASPILQPATGML